MKYKKSMFVLVLVIFLFSFAAVSASDVDDTVIASEDAEIELSSNSIETDNLKTNDHNWPIAEESIDDDNLEDRIHDDFALGANENSVLKEGEAGSFTDLNRLINVDNKDNDTITLNGNYKYVSGDEDFIIGINIARSLTIDGNGATLDGSNSARILRISTSDKVILKNINFINGKAEGENTFYSNGGAIYDNSGCTIENCNFTNNYANYDGGAVYGHNTITILRNCTFTQNRANAIGGAASQSSAINCTFNENSGRYGGALGVSNALNCIFNGNSGRRGGAMYLGNAALCTFKTGSDTTYNTNIDNATLNISNLNNEYNFGDKLIFDLIGAGLHCDGMKVKINIYYLSGDLMGTYYGFTGKDGGLIINFDYGEYLAKLSLEGYAKVEDATATINVTAGTTFSDLNKVINDNENDTIILEKNYAYNSDVDSDFVDGITINRPVTINGNGYTIDAKNLARIFQVTIRDVVLENITFINGYTTGSGGAVYFSQSGRIINCNFVDNTANLEGGAIRMSSGTVSNCNFTNNKVTGTESWGGAIRMSSGTVSNCNFVNNTASEEGGAIRFSGTGTVSNCNFTGNTAGDWGGAIRMSSGSVSNCNFVNNTASGWGGAIRFGGTGTVTNCNFTNNSASVEGGAIWMSSGSVSNCNFTGNTASENGGAINMGSGTVSNCNFTGNTASNNGGAVHFLDQGTVSNCNFTGNTATGDGGAIYFTQDATGNVINCNFTNNSAMGGGAVYFNSTGEVICCNFVNNLVEILEDCEGGGGALRFSKDGTIINCNFINNVAVESWGAAVYFDGHDATGTIITCNFTNNAATVDGGAISFNNHNIVGNVRSCNFANNTGRWGGAIDAAGICNVSSCNFSYNKALDGSGGAIYFNLKGEVTDCNFIGNSVWGKNKDGGAIQIYSGKVTRCNFTDNSASSDGGAISFSLNTEVTNCNFANNKAISGEGGAIYIWDTYETGSTIENCSFINNQATSGHGGAIYFRKFCNVENCNFTDNSATVNGGAVFFNGNGEVTNCNFTDNTASSQGGAIRFSGSGTVTNCNFTDNEAYSGGAVYFYYEGTVTNCNFAGNNATGNGGAINMGSGTVSNCNFAGNNATTGSAIYFFKWDSSDTLTVSDSTFLNNRANAGALDIVKTENNITITFTGQNNLLNAIYSGEDAEVAFYNVTYWGAKGITTVSSTMSGSNKAAGQNITVKGVVNGKIIDKINVTDENGEIVLDDAGDYWIIVSHKGDLYYTEIAETLFTNMKLYANVTSLTTNNKTVNITAKSNIPNDVVQGKLLFILPNGTQIEATYGANDTWWTVHEFDKYDVYQVNATYVGLDNVTINNGTITINKLNSTISLDNIVLDYGESENVTVTTTGATGITAKIGESEANVTGFVISIPALDAGTYTLTVTTITDDDYNPVTKEVNITVNKVNSTLTVGDMVFDYGSSGSIIVSVTGADGVNANVVGQPKAVVKVNGTNITVSDLDAGTYTLTVTAIGDKNHNNITKNATITVNKLKTELTGNAITTTYNINKDLVITLKDSTGKALSGVKVTVDLNGAKTYTTDKNGQVKVSTKGLAPKAYTAKVTFNGDTNYDKSNKDIKVTVKKATPKLTAKKKTFKTNTKTKKYTIVLKDNTGKAIKKAKVTLKVKGKTYKATTNSKGKATFKITKLNKKGTFKATITYKGNKYYNKVSKKAKIKVIVTFKTVSKGSKDKATVKEIQQALKDKGYYLTYQGHYLKVDGKFKGCTERSLKEFQKDNGLKVTGKVDEKTAKKLGIL